MNYKKFKDIKLSTLGMGNMRLPTNSEGDINQEKAREIIEYAYRHGINYFDTAYRYHSGQSESFVGEVLKQFPRESYFLATKLPGHMMNYQNGKLGFQGYLANEQVTSIEAIFEEQLAKCQVDYFDFYLLHNLCETSYDFYTNKELAVIDYLLKQKELGRIRYLGFSSHARAETIEAFLKEYNCFDFAQIQLNYLDWTLQNARKKYQILTDYQIPIMVMEPVRGGKLVTLPKKAEDLLKQERPNDSVVSWAFRFLQSLPNVQLVLSGMSTMDQIKENISIFSKEDILNTKEQDILNQVVDLISDFVPCTACRYCVEDCPKKLDIPTLISYYNEMKHDGYGLLGFNMGNMEEEQLPSACIACNACTKACPQGIQIPETMSFFAKMLSQRKSQQK